MTGVRGKTIAVGLRVALIASFAIMVFPLAYASAESCKRKECFNTHVFSVCGREQDGWMPVHRAVIQK